MRLFHCGLAAAILLSASAVPADDIVVESRAEGRGHSGYKELEGKWMDSNTPVSRAKSTAPGVSAGTIGSRKFMFSPEGTTATAAPAKPAVPSRVRFSPNVSAAGSYYVYATWPGAANAGPINLTVRHAKGEEKRTIEQDGWGVVKTGGNANQWVPLGNYEFKPGEDQYVEMATGPDVKALGPNLAGQVYADAVRFTTDALGADQLHGPKPKAVAKTPAPDEPLQWQYDLATAQGIANDRGKRILLFFQSPGSPASQRMEDALNDPAVRAVLNSDYVCVRLNFAENTDMAYRLRVFRGGTLSLYDSTGNALGMVTESMTPRDMAARLKVR